jgi:hypothetical protein
MNPGSGRRAWRRPWLLRLRGDEPRLRVLRDRDHQNRRIVITAIVITGIGAS